MSWVIAHAISAVKSETPQVPSLRGGRRISQLEGCRIPVEMAKAVFRFSWRILDLGGGDERFGRCRCGEVAASAPRQSSQTDI